MFFGKIDRRRYLLVVEAGSGYSLERYHGEASLFTCPKCGARHSLTRYVDKEGRYIADNVGRCNRGTACGYHYTPSRYFADHPEAKATGVKKP